MMNASQIISLFTDPFAKEERMCLRKDILNYSDAINLKSISDFQIQGLWIVGWLSLLEYVVLWYQSKPLPAAHENLLSMTHGVFNTLITLSGRTFEFNIYLWLWKDYAIWPHLFSDSFFSFMVTVIFMDFGYYWFHRASHEIMLFWAIHQVHHSSADLTISVGLRHSPLQNLFSWVFYLPLALIGLPPSHLVFHLQLSLLLQTWLHTCTLDKLGPLEWVLNTPSHHRVHHGTTKYCLDKNFGGIFIIWDLLFGSFQREIPEEEMIYGLVVHPEFWNILYQQVFYIVATFEKASSMTSWKNYFETFIKGPSWWPGLTWTGREADAPTFNSMTTFTYTAYNFFILAALTNVGIIYEGKPVAAKIERYRCLVGLLFSVTVPVTAGMTHLFLLKLYFISLVIWLTPQRTPIFLKKETREGTREE